MCFAITHESLVDLLAASVVIRENGKTITQKIDHWVIANAVKDLDSDRADEDTVYRIFAELAFDAQCPGTKDPAPDQWPCSGKRIEPGAQISVFWLRRPLAVAYLVVVLSFWIMAKGRWRKIGLTVATSVLVLVWWFTLQPSNDRDWQPDVAVLAYADINGNRVAFHNLRNCDYRTETDFDVRHYDKTFDLDPGCCWFDPEQKSPAGRSAGARLSVLSTERRLCGTNF